MSRSLHVSAQVKLSGSVSSQYLTALLMAAPLATGASGIDIRITDELVSQPYVDMTVRLMERFGVTVSGPRAVRVPCMCMHTTSPGGQWHFSCTRLLIYVRVSL